MLNVRNLSVFTRIIHMNKKFEEEAKEEAYKKVKTRFKETGTRNTYGLIRNTSEIFGVFQT